MGRNLMTQKDPVCGMQMEEKEAKAEMEYEGKKFYFCSEECKDLFSMNPAKYLKFRV
jgi:Cu+-exporting ATPase